MSNIRTRIVPSAGAWLPAFLLLVLAACGGGGAGGASGDTDVGPDTGPPPATGVDIAWAEFEPGPTGYAVLAKLGLTRPATLVSARFIVHTRPDARAADVQATYTRAWLLAKGRLDEALGTLSMPVFGLYAGDTSAVTIELTFADEPTISRGYSVLTAPVPPHEQGAVLDVVTAAPDLATQFMYVQTFNGPTIVDIDGTVRWQAPRLPEFVFARAFTPDGLLVGSLGSGALWMIDWLGSFESHVMSDPRLTASHHNIEPGKVGYLNTVTFRDGAIHRPESVVVEMTETGQILRTWDLDLIFAQHISAYGEDPSLLVQNDVDWFHMNSATYDASDDSLVLSSRENFIVKIDYETGAIRWILGNPAKLWYTAYPLSLQPYALLCDGDVPIGQHSLSVSDDGRFLTCFNNGLGNTVLADVGDSRDYSKVSVYRIDADARTAEEVQTFDVGQTIYSPICSSGYRTRAGHMLATFSNPDDGRFPVVFILDDAQRILFEANVEGDGCAAAYAVVEVPFEDMRFDAAAP